MRIMHVADTHLGFSAYRKVEEISGLNQREMDLYHSFETCVDQALEQRPDLFLHAGDLFDNVRPSNRAISFAVEQFVRLSDAAIPTVVIAGNHSTPKLRETGSVFKIFEHLKGIHPVYAGAYERVMLEGVVVHCIPHSDPVTMQQELAKVEVDQDLVNIATLHASVGAVGAYASNEFNETVIPDGTLPRGMEYTALGHYHRHTEVAPMTFYSGSTERLSFSEAGQDKGYLMVDLPRAKVRFAPLPTRPMFDLPHIEAKDMSAADLMREIEGRLAAQELEGALVRFTVHNVRPSLYRSLDFKRIQCWAQKALYLEPRYQLQDDEFSVQTASGITALDQEFNSFMDHYPVIGTDKDRVRELGLRYLSRGSERCD
jgi:DNA repair protein SbcD/Mre11